LQYNCNYDCGSDNVPEDTDDELLSASGSRNHNDVTGSSSSSSDTDIDEIVDEFEQRRLAAVAQARADDQLIDVRCPSDVTHRHAVRAVAAFVTSALVLFTVLVHAPRPGNYLCLKGYVVRGVWLIYL